MSLVYARLQSFMSLSMVIKRSAVYILSLSILVAAAAIPESNDVPRNPHWMPIIYDQDVLAPVPGHRLARLMVEGEKLSDTYKEPFPKPPNASQVWAYPLQYPWRPLHETRPGRKNHQLWNKDMEHAYCVHVNPAYRQPTTPFVNFLGSNCSDILRAQLPFDPIPEDLKLRQRLRYECRVDNPDANSSRLTDYEYNLHMENYRWDEGEHCRAGCETCFDAMEEYGAEGAWCARSVKRATCQMALIKKTETHRWNTQEPWADRFVYYGDDVENSKRVPAGMLQNFDPGQTYYLPDG